jgi:hypothetical protein
MDDYQTPFENQFPALGRLFNRWLFEAEPAEYEVAACLQSIAIIIVACDECKWPMSPHVFLGLLHAANERAEFCLASESTDD